MKLLRTLFLLLLLALVALVGLVALMPAKVAVDWAGERLRPLQLDDVSGTIWRGQAARASVHGQNVGALGWRVHPLALLSARLDTDLVLQGGDYEGTTFASISGSTVRLRDARLNLAAQRLQPALDIPALELRGRVEVELTEAELVAGFPRRLEGRAHWRQAAVSGRAEAALGDLLAEFRTSADGALIGTAKDLGGPLMLDGQFRAALTGYEVDALLAARDGNPQVLEALKYIGEQQPDGSSVLEIRGRLLPVR